MIAARIWLLNTILITVCLLLIANNVLSKCNDEIDCHFNGVCRNDLCICNDGWQGSKCQFCAGKIKLTGKSGIITDGIGNYSLGLKCTWLIQAEHNETISLYFNEFATECNWDYFYVYDGDSVKAPLIAAFNGIMFHKTYQIKRVPEIKLKSGFGLLHFASDDAYNMTGFNISYNMNKCPSDALDTECSNHGACTSTNDCTCSAQWSGEACQNSFCPNDCDHHGTCNYEKHRCDCDRGFAGPDCSQLAKYGFWQAFQHPMAVPSTSHSSVIWNHSLLILSGYNFQKRLENHNFELNTYNLLTKEWSTFLQPQEEKDSSENVSEKLTLLPRYSHATVVHNDKLYVYGGVTVSRVSGEVPTNEFLQFDLKTNSWSTISVTNCNRCVSPFRVFGHTMNLFEKRRLIIIFGFSPDFGFLNHVQEYDLENRKWSIVDTKGFPVKGTYGHTTAFDMWTNKFFVYGGIVVSSDSNQKLTNRIYSYDPKIQTWMLLASSPSARFFHSSVFLSPGLMIVFGGNTHNDTSHNYGAKCYSSESLVYDTMCDLWYSLKSPTNDLLQTDVARFGHSSNTYNNSVYIYGGFNGLILNDLLQFHAGQCNEFVNQNDCLNSRPGIKCIWNSTETACVMLTNEERFRNIMHTTEGNFAFCEQPSRSVNTKNTLMDPEQCASFSDCLSCNETSRKCVWCTNGVCSYEKCREQHQPITDCGRFHFDAYPYCSHLKTCKSCDLNKKCAWNPNDAKCESISEVSMSLEENFSKTTYCDTSCDTFQSCMNCTMEKCIWCQNEQRCVDKNAYTLTFPYGQCREWTTMPLKCRTADNSKDTYLGDECGAYKSCRHCLENPSCGWCDSGYNTGLGTCLSGGYSGVHDREFAKMCPPSVWHFTSCPKCQCNGHSHCLNNSSKCEQPCQDLATGTHCDKCSIGYWGNPLNGGKCQPCDCNGRATLCHPETGKCLCTMKGVTGDRCNKCDITNHYHEDVYKKGVCYYDLTIDYQFTFNLSKKEDRYYSQINFRNSPIKPDIDADFQITSSVSAKMNITIRQYKSEEKVLFSSQNFTSFRYRFTKSDYIFGQGDNLSLTTFYVYVYDFKPPLWIQISFSQYPKLNLQQFFITFTTCFLLLLMVAILLWRIKQRFDMYRRRQRLFVEMEQMASRPFAKVFLECNSHPPPSAKESKNRIATNPVALEPCEGNKAAVLTILVRLPVGSSETQYTQPGQPAGLAIACALVSLSPNNHKNSLDSFSTMKPSNNSRLFSRKFRRSAPNT